MSTFSSLNYFVKKQSSIFVLLLNLNAKASIFDIDFKVILLEYLFSLTITVALEKQTAHTKDFG